MFAKAVNNKNKLQQRASKNILKIYYERFFRLDAKETIFTLIQKGPTRRKKIIENTRKHAFLKDIIAYKILQILTFLKSMKFLNSLL